MFIDVNYLLNSGLLISDEISTERLEMAIKTTELYVVKPRLTDEKYIEITSNPTEYETLLEGGIVTDENGKQFYVAGLKSAMCHLTFAFLLRDNLNVTSFSTVRKTDDYSENVGDDKIGIVGMQHGEIGMQYLKEITDYLHIKYDRKNLPNTYFSEYL